MWQLPGRPPPPLTMHATSLAWIVLLVLVREASALLIEQPPAALAVTTACPQNCSGHGRCLVATGSCHCFEGWSGGACDAENATAGICSIDCSGHGYCRGSTCLCDEFWRGMHCEVPAACPHGCSGNGHCVDGKRCRCDPDHTGDDCSRPVARCPGFPRVCGGLEHGTCSAAGECACRPAWRGAACEQSTAYKECPRAPVYARRRPGANETCFGHGLCDPEGSGRCLCEPTWEGIACERPLGTLNLAQTLLRVLMGLVLFVALAAAGVITWFVRVRGVTPRDVLRGQWHVRKEEGWRRGEAEGQMPGARYDIYGEWVPGK